jgi:hypothetical protein
LPLLLLHNRHQSRPLPGLHLISEGIKQNGIHLYLSIYLDNPIFCMSYDLDKTFFFS